MRRRTRILMKRFLRNVLLTLLIPPAARLAFRLAWGDEASHRLTATRAKLHAMGIPTSPADLPDPSKIPPDQDAVNPFEHALANFKLSHDDSNIISPEVSRDIESSVLSDTEIAGFDRIASEQKPALQELDLAAARKLFGWPVSYSYYFGTGERFPLAASSEITRFFGWTAVIDLGRHQDAEALHNIRRAVALANIQDHWPVLIAHLVATYQFLLTSEFADRLAPQLDWSNTQVQAQGKLLLTEFKDDFDEPSAARAWRGETVFLDSEIAETGRKGISWLFAPLPDDDEAQGLQIYARGFPAAAARNFPQSKSAVPPHNAFSDTRLATLLHLFSTQTDDEPVRLHLLHSQDLAAVRSTEILLAAEMFRQSHGQYPKTAAALVPEFLPAVPSDPFDSGDQPLPYRLDDAGPTVWSVGENGVDDGGTPKAISGSDHFRNQSDFVFGAAWRKHLAEIPPPASAPATR